MRKFGKLLLAFALMAASALALPWFGAALAQKILPQILLVPSRLVFEGRVRNAYLTVNNPSAETQTYRIDILDMTMDAEGEFAIVEPPGRFEPSARNMITFSPRVVTIEAGGAQIVRMLVRKPANLAEGEYRSHLRFLTVPSASAAETPADEADALNIRIRPLYGVTIPILVRHGNQAAASRGRWHDLVSGAQDQGKDNAENDFVFRNDHDGTLGQASNHLL